MKIAFIVSCLEPGRDGVGDYCRRLGSEMIELGCDVILISINDAWQKDKSSEVNGRLVVLRYGTSISLSCRVALIREALKQFHPEWVSLQYVCYGFHPKGLAWRWNRIFSELGRICNHRHLMCHELWIGPPPFHRRLIGLGQKWVIQDMFRRFKPSITTTTMSSYKSKLSEIGITATVIPLFGNIPITSRNDVCVLEIIQRAGSRIAQKPRASFLNGIFFGTIHPDFDGTALILWLKQLKNYSGKSVLLTMIGRTGAASERLAKQLAGAIPDSFEVILLGEQPEEIISKTLQLADFGINTGSSKFLGKSGTFAAMQEHGLPVILADGKLDRSLIRNGAPPVLQFSENDSIAITVNFRRADNKKTSVNEIASALINLYEKIASDRN